MIAAPAKTPEPVVQKLHGEINAILASPRFAGRWRR